MKSDNPEVAFNQEVASLIRSVLYAPDGKPPSGWSIQQDLRIAKMGTVRWNFTDWEAAIRGLRMIYPTGKLTLRLFTAAKCKEGSPLLNRAVETFRKGGKRTPGAGLAKLTIQIGRPAA